MSNTLTFAGYSLPDCYVGVPFLAGIPVYGGTAAMTQTSLIAGSLPPGLSIKASNIPALTGTVIVSGDTGTQVDGNYAFTLLIGDSNGTSSGAFSMNVHYLQGDQDLTVAEQAALRETPFLNASSPDASSFTQTPVATDAG